MSVRKIIFYVFATVLLLSGAAYAFPHDPNPSTIDDTLYTGNWTQQTGRQNLNSIRLINFMINNFEGRSGGSKDMKIWNAPAFEPDKVRQEQAIWNYLLDNPGGSGNVSDSVGRALFTTQPELVEFVEKLPRTNLTLEYLGEIPRGFPYPFLVFSKNADRSPAGLASTGKPLVWIQGNVHGGEMSTAEGAIAMAYDIANGRWDNLLDKINVVIVPRICADGAKVPTRHTADLVALQWTQAPSTRDLNRDNILLDLPVQRAMKKMFSAYQPHYVCDLHERGSNNISTGITNTFRAPGGQGPVFDNDAHDIGASGTILNQATRELIDIRYDIVEPDLAEMGRQYGLTFGFYRDGGSDPYPDDSTSTSLTGTVNSYNPGFAYQDAILNNTNGLTGSNQMITNQAWDPDAPYFMIAEAQYNTRTANNITAMMGTVVQLFENKSGSGRLFWERRVATGYVCLLSTMTTAADRPEVFEKIKDIRKKNIEKGKTVTSDDMIPILQRPPKPTYVMHREWPILDVTLVPESQPTRDTTGVLLYDGTKALRPAQAGETPIGGAVGNYVWVRDESGTRDRQFFKIEETPKAVIERERIRPYAYIFTDPEGAEFSALSGLADELAMRMMLQGIEIKRLTQDVTIEVEGWHYNKRTPTGAQLDQGGPVVDNTDQGSGGWRNRSVTMLPGLTKTFKKDSYVIYLAQPLCNLIPMYMEPDIPWNVASCIFLPAMSAALDPTRGNGWLTVDLVGVEMPAYRYLDEVDLPTYDVDHSYPLVNRGAVARFFKYHTQEEREAIAADCGENSIKAFDYDFHTFPGTDALVDNRFDITLPTNANTFGYLILNVDGAYEALVPHSTMLGMNVATVDIDKHGLIPFTVDIDPSTGRPKVEPGNRRALPVALRDHDDLIGVRVVEILDYTIPDVPSSSSCFGGCNGGYALLALLLVCPIFMRRKGL